MTQKHTQALEKVAYDAAVSEGELEGNFIYFRIPSKDIETNAEIERIRALIAAAPDLLEALKFCATPLNAPNSPDFLERQRVANAAISRAEVQ